METSTTLMQASRQWATRPDDERYTSLLDMQRHFNGVRERSRGVVTTTKQFQVAPLSDDMEAKGLVVVSKNGTVAAPTNWAFGQMMQRAGAGSAGSYIRSLPAPLAADCLNFSLRYQRDPENVGVLLERESTEVTSLRAMTGPNYGRVWNADIVNALVRRFGDGINGDWRVPGEFKQRVPITKENTTLYASDRDMFVFLADEDKRIEMKDRRDGKAGSLARGFFMWNSEVGASTFGFAMFLFDYVCCNRIVWGAQQYHEIKIRHTSSAPERWVDEVIPALQVYANASDAPIRRAIESAQNKKVPDVLEFLRTRFSASQAEGIRAAHLAEEGRPIETLWDVATGVTAYAKGIPHQDRRVDLEREAGKILDMAA